MSSNSDLASNLRTFGFSKLYIVESLPENEPQTGTLLQRKLRTLAGPPSVELIRARSVEDLATGLDHIGREARDLGAGPIVHLEAHGRCDGVGLHLASGELLRWHSLGRRLATINCHCRNNLLVTLFVCYGSDLMRQFAPSTVLDRAPFWMLIASPEKPRMATAELAFEAFYFKLFRGHGGRHAAAELIQRGGFELLPAEAVFRYVWREYLASQGRFWRRRRRVNRLLTEIRESWIGDDFDVAECRRYLQESTKARNHGPLFEAARERYFMVDLCPENDERFPVSLEEVLPRSHWWKFWAS